MRNRLRLGAAGFAVGVLVALASVTSASAAPTSDADRIAPNAAPSVASSPTTSAPVVSPGASASLLTASTSSITTGDPVCEELRDDTGEAGDCAAEVTTSVSAAVSASATQLAADGDATASDGTTLAQAAAAAAIYTRTWSQSARGLYYFNWTEKHSGRIYFDKAGHVWAMTSRSGYKGSHLCDQGSGIGYSVVVTSCSEEARPDLSNASGHPISEWDYYQVHVVAKGIPLYASHNMHANAYPDGTITFP